ncbi:MAG: hypothetical protein KGO96_04075 [Elusimicrobia bacterium]|nr:hypothetical protein [Elusimicrobiota bacterium]MDE2236677.1 hypothetical protein [Elusimicrobiota bacterium]MDE2425071.1 hypothetical protein [Elusimicrobiota bacterium]
MIHDSIRLKTLESLVAQAAAALQSTSADKKRLERALARAEEENNKLKEEVKRLSSNSVNHERLRARLERLDQKIEKLESP